MKGFFPIVSGATADFEHPFTMSYPRHVDTDEMLPPIRLRHLEFLGADIFNWLAGKIESADVKTGYVHAQGLLVPVVGKLSLVRENGEPSHFLLETSA